MLLDKPFLDVAALQLPQAFGDAETTLSRIHAVFDAGAAEGLDLVLLPEAILTGYVSTHGDFDLSRFAQPLDGPTAERLSGLARQYQVALAGPLIERSQGRCFNSLLLFDAQGDLIGHFRKRHPWFPERWASAGDLGSPTVVFKGFRITAAICFDIHFLSREAGSVLNAADLLLFPTAWVDERPRSDLRARLLPPLCRYHRISLINANWGLSQPALWGQGGSRILDAQGQEVARAGFGRDPELVQARIWRGSREG